MRDERLRNGVDLSSAAAVKRAIRYHAEQDTSWKHHDLAVTLYRWADLLTENLIDPVARPGIDRMPAPIIGFEKDDIRTLAYYTLGKNPTGIEDQIVLNEHHLNRPLYSILESLCHELLHLKQQRRGKHPYVRGSDTHNNEFVYDLAEPIGLHPTPVKGYHWKQADGPFRDLAVSRGIEVPPAETLDKKAKKNWWDVEKPKGRSTLTKYSCPGCGLNVRVGVSNEVTLACVPCSRIKGSEVILVRA